MQQILHVVDKNILQNFPILREDVGIDEDIYGLSLPHLQGKTACHKFHHVEPIVVLSYPKVILDRYNNVTLCFDIMHINVIE